MVGEWAVSYSTSIFVKGNVMQNLVLNKTADAK